MPATLRSYLKDLGDRLIEIDEEVDPVRQVGIRRVKIGNLICIHLSKFLLCSPAGRGRPPVHPFSRN